MLFHFLFIVAMSVFSSGQQCLDLFSSVHPPQVEASQVRPLTFTNVEVFRRNNNIGVQQVGEIRLERWIEIAPFVEEAYNFVGITAEGRVYHVIDWHGQRRVARLLSGHREFADVSIVDGQVLVAQDRAGQIYLYSPSRWAEPASRAVVKRGAMIWSGLTFVLTSGLYLTVPDAVNWNAYVGSVPIPLPAAFVGVISGLQTGLVMLNRFDHFNTYPDGFIKTSLIAKDPQDIPALFSTLDPRTVESVLLREDLALPSRDLFAPPLPEAATEDIR